MHSAGFALDPEFIQSLKGTRQRHTQSGLQSVIEKVCLRDEIFESANAAEAQQTLTVLDSAAVQAPRGMHLQHRSPHIPHSADTPLVTKRFATYSAARYARSLHIHPSLASLRSI